MPLTKESILAALARLPSGAEARKVAWCDGHASVTVAVPASAGPDARDALQRHVDAAVRRAAADAGDQLRHLHVEFVPAAAPAAPPPPPPHPPPPPRPGRQAPAGAPAAAGVAPHQPPPGPSPARFIVAVGAGKGGVGKSTIAVNLAVGLARRGHAVGLLDGDIYGPSLPTMLGLGALDPVVVAGRIQPFYVHGVKAMTIGRLVEPEKPLIWRGPMAHGAFKQLLEQTDWGAADSDSDGDGAEGAPPLDYLVIDLPPGTGDVSLTMAQSLRLTGAVIVCTPQRVAQDDAVRALRMFQQLNVEILGVVENMSTFIADDLDPPREYDLFGKGGAQRMAQRLGVPFLGAVPITVALRVNCDRGDPSANFAPPPPRAGAAPAASLAGALESLVANLETQVALAAIRSGAAAPTLTVH
jgi:ATP-binding protein involved in chromosome partitioning